MSGALPSVGLPPVQSDYIAQIEAILASGVNEAEVPIEIRTIYRTQGDMNKPPPGGPGSQGDDEITERDNQYIRRSSRVAQVRAAQQMALNEAGLQERAEEAARIAKSNIRKIMFSTKGPDRRKRYQKVSADIDRLKKENAQDLIRVTIGSPALNAIYRHASQSLFPLFMVPESAMRIAAGTAGVSFNDFFTKKLTSICEQVWGGRVVAAIKANSPKQDLRKFFEVAAAGQQCDVVIGPYDTKTGNTSCWICQTPVGNGNSDKDKLGYPECEHLLPVLWALLVSGLYDAALAKILSPQERGLYIDLLKREYAWAHSRCNQIKSHTVYLQATIEKRGGTGYAKFGVNVNNIRADLETIIDKKYDHYRPTHTELRKTVGDRGAWIARSITKITEVLTNNFVNKLNTLNPPVGTMVSRFTTGLLDRAVGHAGKIVRAVLAEKNAVNEEQFTRWTQAFARLSTLSGGRKTTYRKNQRGGISFRGQVQAEKRESAFAYIADFVVDITKAMCLHALQKSNFAAKREAIVKNTWPIPFQLETDIEQAFIRGTDTLAVHVMQDILARPTLPETAAQFGVEVVITVHAHAIQGREYQKEIGETTPVTTWLLQYEAPYEGFAPSAVSAGDEGVASVTSVPAPASAPVSAQSTPIRPSALDTAAANGKLIKDGTPEGSVPSTPAQRPPPSAQFSPQAASDPNASVASRQGSMPRTGLSIGLGASASDPSGPFSPRGQTGPASTDASGSATPPESLPAVSRTKSGLSVLAAAADSLAASAPPAPKGGAFGPKPSWL